MRHPETAFILKYFELADEFIKVRTSSDQLLASLSEKITEEGAACNKSSYRDALVRTCIPELESSVLPGLERTIGEYDLDAVYDLLYGLCIEVNPSLEIHQVGLPIAGASKELELASITTPAGRAAPAFLKRLQDLEANLSTDVYAQDDIVAEVAREIRLEGGVRLTNSPIGRFLFLGSTGVGKTELSKSIARHLFDDPNALIRVDCSEYALPHDYAKLIGSPPGYIGHDEGGALTKALSKYRSGVVLFDEIEKAHPKVHQLLLGLLDEGRITDSKGKTYDLKQWVIVMTANVGAEKLESARDGGLGFGKRGGSAVNENAKEIIAQELRAIFKPEFRSRISILPFRNFEFEECLEIARRKLAKHEKVLQRMGFNVYFEQGIVRRAFPTNYDPQYGARDVDNNLRRHVLNPFRDWATDAGTKPDPSTYSRIDIMERNSELVAVLQRPRSTPQTVSLERFGPAKQLPQSSGNADSSTQMSLKRRSSADGPQLGDGEQPGIA